MENKGQFEQPGSISGSGDGDYGGEKLFDLSFLWESGHQDKNFVILMVKGFLEHTPDSLAKITAHLKDKSWDRVHGIAHKMKPSIDFMGIKILKEDIRNIEKYSDMREVDEAKVTALVQRLNDICESAMQQLREELSRLSEE